MTVPQLFSEQEVAKRLRCSVDTIRRERKRGLIGYQLVGSRIYYTEDQIIEYLEIKRIGPCHTKITNEQGKLGIIGSHNVRTVRSGAGHGSIRTPDRHAAHHLAQLTFGKPG